MAIFRWFFGLPSAAIITSILFLIMAGLVRPPVTDWPAPQPSPEFDFIEKKQPPAKPFEAIKPKPLPDTPPIEIEAQPATDRPTQVQVVPQKKQITPGNPDTDNAFPTPVIRHAPLYPENCRSRSAEGRVVVQFDVTPEGNVVNIRVIETPDRCFVRSVRNTVGRWKYPPAYENGRPITRFGLVEVFSFQLQD